MLMPTVNYLTVIDCEHGAENRNKSYRRAHRNEEEAHKGLPIF